MDKDPVPGQRSSPEGSGRKIDVAQLHLEVPALHDLTKTEIAQLQESADALAAAPAGQHKRALISEVDKYPDDDRGRILMSHLLTIIKARVFGE